MLVSVDQLSVAADVLVDPAIHLSQPGRVDVGLIRLIDIIKAEETALDDDGSIRRSEREECPLDVSHLRCHESSHGRQADIGPDEDLLSRLFSCHEEPMAA